MCVLIVTEEQMDVCTEVGHLGHSVSREAARCGCSDLPSHKPRIPAPTAPGNGYP
jgi:hypothetical protein